VIGICNSWSELVSCNLHFRGLADAARRGVLQAGGLPLEFPTMSLGENLLKPTAMLYRNLMAMDVEESIRGYPFDAVVLLGGCDKTVPAQLMGAASADVPAIAVTGGPANPAVFRGQRLGVGTDLWHYADEFRSGRIAERLGDGSHGRGGAELGAVPAPLGRILAISGVRADIWANRSRVSGTPARERGHRGGPCQLGARRGLMEQRE
jgi:dihydroxy-acid dehydratase